MSVCCTVYAIFSIKEWRDLETGDRGRSRSLEIAPFDRPHTTFYWSAIVYIALSGTVFELPYLTLKNIVTLKSGSEDTESHSTSSSSRMRVMNHNWSATKQRLQLFIRRV